jgi:hypothetical protein
MHGRSDERYGGPRKTKAVLQEREEPKTDVPSLLHHLNTFEHYKLC